MQVSIADRIYQMSFKIAGALQEFYNRWCMRHVESNAFDTGKLN